LACHRCPLYVTSAPPVYARLLAHAATPEQLPLPPDDVVVGAVLVGVVVVGFVVVPVDELVGIAAPPHALTANIHQPPLRCASGRQKKSLKLNTH
jgi:hypothetical protein